MARQFDGERIEVLAANPHAEVACDITIATPEARAGLGPDLAAGIIPPPREIDGGVEVRFKPGAWDAVQRYIALESECCSFLTLSADRDESGVLLRVTGRDDAVPFIRSIFS